MCSFLLILLSFWEVSALFPGRALPGLIVASRMLWPPPWSQWVSPFQLNLELEAWWPCPRPVSSKYRLKLLASSGRWRPSHWYKEAFVLHVVHWIFCVVKTSIRSKRTAGSITSSSHNSRVTGELCIRYCESISVNNSRCHPELPPEKEEKEAPAPHVHLLPDRFPASFKAGFSRIHTLSYKYHLVQKEYLQCLLMDVAGKEHVFKTGACRSPGLCSCLCLLAGWRETVSAFLSHRKSFRKMNNLTPRIWEESASMVEENW